LLFVFLLLKEGDNFWDKEVRESKK
jgi:hypothetical protein